MDYSKYETYLPRRLYRWSHRLTGLFFKIMGNMTVKGVENIPNEGGVLIVSNHISLLDPVIVGSAVQREIHFMARSDVFKVPILSNIITAYNAFPVNRWAPDLGALRRTISLLKAGNSVLMFPEGTRSADGNLGKTNDGACFIAHRANVPTIPVFHSGVQKMLPRGSRRLRRAKLTVSFGEPIDFSEIAETDVKREMYQQMGIRMIDAITKLSKDNDQY
ncbi:1-acyl-sn-glycerol-3-phosphate acyltransferase [Candidatus Poribacteria bacterium]|nr:1-acyl-sn-glycerol-3-phosphate acyltransferase [Candidatus Poribacteria bacterium]